MSFAGTETPTVILAGRYRLGEPLGEGPCGHVLAAHDMLLDRPVAVKVLDGLPDDVAVRRALRAARAAAAVTSAHLLAVLDVDEADPPFVVLEHVDAKPLSTLLAGGPLPEADARRIRAAVLAGLADLHAAGVVHRDVRAQNVLVTTDGRTLLTSAGLSEAARDQELGLRITPEPRRRKVAPSPEQELGLPADPRSDVMAAGALLRTLPVGQGVVKGEGEVNAVLRRATSQDPHERQQDAAELAAEFAAAERAAAAAPVAPPRPTAKPRHARVRSGGDRRRVVLGLLGVAALVVAGALALAGISRLNGERAPATASLPAPAPEPSTTISAVVDLGRTRTDLGPQGGAFVDRLAALAALQGPERAAEVADLYGQAVVDVEAGAPSASYSAGAAAALRPELTLDGVVALGDRDPAALGERGVMFAERLRSLGQLRGETQAAEAGVLLEVAEVAEADGDLTPTFARAANEVLRQVSAVATAGASASAQNP